MTVPPMSVVSTVLAAIINDSQGEHFVIWNDPAYALGDATFARLSGHLSEVSGRRLANVAPFFDACEIVLLLNKKTFFDGFLFSFNFFCFCSR